MKIKNILICLIALFMVINISAQKSVIEKTLTRNYTQEEVVTLAETISFAEAIEFLSGISEKFTGKKIANTAGINIAIGIPIEKQFYKQALYIIANYHNLTVDERENVIVVMKKDDPKAGLDVKTYADFDEPEVKISAVFFEANVTALDEKGINWELMFSGKGVKVGGEILTFGVRDETQQNQQQQQQLQRPPEFVLSTETNFSIGNITGNAAAAIKFFETENLGQVIAKPSVNVRNQVQGRIQIGSDFSVKQKDFAGNVTEQFIPTGTIVEVTPYIHKKDGVDYCLLKLKVEKSSAVVDQLTTEIKKTQAATEVLLLDGEETIIGGLFSTEEVHSRRGIPFLRDLPWWFFGIRYLTGYESKQTIKKELIIVIKAEIIPSLSKRLNMEKPENIIKDRMLKDESEIEKIKIHKLN